MMLNPDYVKSPLNYTGGKFKLLPQLNEHLPSEHFDTFIDVFSGGGNVGINSNCDKTICIDVNQKLIGLMNYFQSIPHDELERQLLEKIEYYGLCNVIPEDYKTYGRTGGEAMSVINKPNFCKLREDYNNTEPRDPLLFFLLIIFSFNNQIRFNRKNQYNMPVGKSYFNTSIRNKLKLFIERINSMDIQFVCNTFECLYDYEFNDKTFVYLDPPYLLGVASYNENGGWDETKDAAMFKLLDYLNEKGISFAMSNVLQHKGQFHDAMNEWVNSNPNYRIIDLTYDYSNASYQLIDRSKKTREVLIVNY